MKQPLLNWEVVLLVQEVTVTKLLVVISVMLRTVAQNLTRNAFLSSSLQYQIHRRPLVTPLKGCNPKVMIKKVSPPLLVPK